MQVLVVTYITARELKSKKLGMRESYMIEIIIKKCFENKLLKIVEMDCSLNNLYEL